MLGAPLGSEEFVSTFVRSASEEDTRGLDMLPRLCDPQVAFRRLTMVFAQRPSCLTRVCPPTSDVLVQLEGYNARMMSTLGSLLGPRELESSTSKLARQLAVFPLSCGRVGLVRLATSAPRAYLGSIALFARALTAHFQQHSEALCTV